MGTGDDSNPIDHAEGTRFSSTKVYPACSANKHRKYKQTPTAEHANPSDMSPGAQTERQRPAGQVTLLLGGEDSPAALFSEGPAIPGIAGPRFGCLAQVLAL